MKPGTRALGVAESYTGDASTLAGAVTTGRGRVDDLVFGRCTVGGTDSTDAIIGLFDRLDREDVRLVLVAGVALAWYNIVDLDRLAGAVDRPVIAVTFEDSDGLAEPIEAAFDGAPARDRQRRYDALPERRPIDLDGRTVYGRAVHLAEDRMASLVAAFTDEGAARPEPLRVAKLAARAGEAFVSSEAGGVSAR